MSPKKSRVFAALARNQRGGRSTAIEVRTPGHHIAAEVRAGGLRIDPPSRIRGLHPYRTLN